jgi:hypothetical protein
MEFTLAAESSGVSKKPRAFLIKSSNPTLKDKISPRKTSL